MKSGEKEMNVISENQTVFSNCVGFKKKNNIYQSQFINSEEVRWQHTSWSLTERKLIHISELNSSYCKYNQAQIE